MKGINSLLLILILSISSVSSFSQIEEKHKLYFSVETFDYDYYNQLVNRTEVAHTSNINYLKTENGYWEIKVSLAYRSVREPWLLLPFFIFLLINRKHFVY